MRSLRFIANQLRMTEFPVSCFNQFSAQRETWWWTGEDSNLRSPQGAADLQSAGFSHSPTRPRKISSETSTAYVRQITRRAKTQNGLVSRDTSPSILISRIRSASLPCKFSGGAGGGN